MEEGSLKNIKNVYNLTSELSTSIQRFRIIVVLIVVLIFKKQHRKKNKIDIIVGGRGVFEIKCAFW